MPPQPTGQRLKDFLFAFEAGMNNGIAPLLLQKNQMSIGRNTTVRGTFVKTRPAFRKIALDFSAFPSGSAVFNKVLFQEANSFNPTGSPDQLVMAAAGHIYQIIASDTTATVADVTGNVVLSSTQTQLWSWQAERWIVFNDGVNNPVRFDGTTPTQNTSSGYSVTLKNLNDVPTSTKNAGALIFIISATAGTTSGAMSFPSGLAAGGSTAVTINIGVFQPQVGNYLSIGTSTFIVSSFVGSAYTLTAAEAIPAGTNIASGTTVFITFLKGSVLSNFTVPAVNSTVNADVSSPLPPGPGTYVVGGYYYLVTAVGASSLTELPPGRMGAYINGRNWITLTDGKSYIGSDLVGTSSGTQAENFKDAIFKETQNPQLAAGGTFFIPGANANITAIIEIPTLDAALGQGPAQVFTSQKVFSCNAPIDNTEWVKTSYTSPIQSVSLINSGSVSQWSTVSINADTIFRSTDGFRSLILARRDFDTWGNTPISREVDPVITRDNPNLYPWISGIEFDNRYIATSNPTQTAYGVYWNAMVVINEDPLSSLRGKAPAVWDGVWTGLNVLKLVKGTFSGVDRAFAFCLNLTTNDIELYEILKTDQALYDNTNVPIVWDFESPVIDFGQKDPRLRQYKCLKAGEIYVDKVQGRVDFEVWYRPDEYPLWTLWHKWTEDANMLPPNSQPQFRPRMGLGEPDGGVFDTSTNRPLREGYTFQVKVVVTGYCVFKGAKFECDTIPEPEVAPPA